MSNKKVIGLGAAVAATIVTGYFVTKNTGAIDVDVDEIKKKKEEASDEIKSGITDISDKVKDTIEDARKDK